MGQDLGTHHLRVEFCNARGYIEAVNTGMRFTGGTQETSPLDAKRIRPAWQDEEELVSTLVYLYTEGNYSCDCNRLLFIARSYHEEEPDDPDCGDNIRLRRLTLIRPDATERVIWGL